MNPLNTRILQSQSLRQEMKANPRLYQAMELLYMPLLDLQQHLKMELEGNPFLEMAEADLQEEIELKEDGEDESAEEDVDWEEILLEGFDSGERREQYEVRDFFQPTPVESMDLRDHLYDQLRMLDITEREMRLGEEIIGNVNDAGMLTCSLQDFPFILILIIEKKSMATM